MTARRRRTTGLALGALVPLGLAGQAAAATKTVTAGAGKGVYDSVCLIHPEMHGKITVTVP